MESGHSLTAVCEEDVEQEEDSVDDGQRSLGHGVATRLRLEAAVPVLDDQHSGGNEERTPDQAEEGVDALVQGGADQVACGWTKGKGSLDFRSIGTTVRLEYSLTKRPIRMMEKPTKVPEVNIMVWASLSPKLL